MNASCFLNKKVLGALVLLLLVGAGGLVWMERTSLLTWYYVHNLARAGEASRARWAERVAGLGEPALGDVLECLNDPSPECCANARAALEKLTGQWGPADAHTVALALRCGRAFQHLSTPGQRNVLELAAGWFTARPDNAASTAGLVPPCSRLLAEAAATKDPDVPARALELCTVLSRQAQGNEALSSARELVRACLSSDRAEVRVRAVRLTVPPLTPGSDPLEMEAAPGLDLTEQVVPLLSDPVVEVRRAALLAVRLAKETVLEDALLPCLHDPDEEVRHLCEEALRFRGRTPQQIKLGRLLTDPNPAERRKVLLLLPAMPELDPVLWLQRLSRDPAGSVRINTLTPMALYPEAMRPRVEEMSRQDPNETVRQQARVWLENPRTFLPDYLE